MTHHHHTTVAFSFTYRFWGVNGGLLRHSLLLLLLPALCHQGPVTVAGSPRDEVPPAAYSYANQIAIARVRLRGGKLRARMILRVRLCRILHPNLLVLRLVDFHTISLYDLEKKVTICIFSSY